MALVPRPKFVSPLMIPVVAVNIPEIPIPIGPSNTAINLERIIDIIILITGKIINKQFILSWENQKVLMTQ